MYGAVGAAAGVDYDLSAWACFVPSDFDWAG